MTSSLLITIISALYVFEAGRQFNKDSMTSDEQDRWAEYLADHPEWQKTLLWISTAAVNVLWSGGKLAVAILVADWVLRLAGYPLNIWQ